MFGTKRKREAAFSMAGTKRLTKNSPCPLAGHTHPIKYCPVVKANQLKLESQAAEKTADEKTEAGQ